MVQQGVLNAIKMSKQKSNKPKSYLITNPAPVVIKLMDKKIEEKNKKAELITP